MNEPIGTRINPEIPQGEEKKAEAPPGLEVKEEPQRPSVKEEKKNEEPSVTPEMIIEEPGEPIKEAKRPVVVNQPSVLEEGDVSDEPINTQNQASRLQDEINSL